MRYWSLPILITLLLLILSDAYLPPTILCLTDLSFLSVDLSPTPLFAPSPARSTCGDRTVHPAGRAEHAYTCPRSWVVVEAAQGADIRCISDQAAAVLAVCLVADDPDTVLDPDGDVGIRVQLISLATCQVLDHATLAVLDLGDKARSRIFHQTFVRAVKAVVSASAVQVPGAASHRGVISAVHPSPVGVVVPRGEEDAVGPVVPFEEDDGRLVQAGCRDCQMVLHVDRVDPFEEDRWERIAGLTEVHLVEVSVGTVPESQPEDGQRVVLVAVQRDQLGAVTSLFPVLEVPLVLEAVELPTLLSAYGHSGQVDPAVDPDMSDTAEKGERDLDSSRFAGGNPSCRCLGNEAYH